MAKISPGPLLASASGSLGEITFRQTRQGLVLQQRSSPHQTSTPAREATWESFRSAMANFARLYSPLKDAIHLQGGRAGQTVMQAFVSAWYRFHRYDTWNMQLTDEVTPVLGILSSDFTLGIATVVTNLDSIAGTYHAHILPSIFRNVYTPTPALQDHPLTIPPTTFAYNHLIPPSSYALFPFHPSEPLSLGKSDAIIRD
ncbi:hypothetical protein LCGC14_1770310 [marine sediment metagenome]|uniref:Uncharacterized protein n=1 Tax=marine sediment metagenome TaxID=412755 RepID=A0A0F9GYG7_9ZZZZ